MRPFPVAKYSSPAASSPKEVNDITRNGSRRRSAARPSCTPTAVHVTAGHRAAAFVMAVDVDRRDELTRSERCVRIARAALEDVPAVVREGGDLCPRPVVDLFPFALTDVADVEVAVRTIE